MKDLNIDVKRLIRDIKEEEKKQKFRKSKRTEYDIWNRRWYNWYYDQYLPLKHTNKKEELEYCDRRKPREIDREREGEPLNIYLKSQHLTKLYCLRAYLRNKKHMTKRRGIAECTLDSNLTFAKSILDKYSIKDKD